MFNVGILLSCQYLLFTIFLYMENQWQLPDFVSTEQDLCRMQCGALMPELGSFCIGIQ